jgi:hypothetical protein
VDSKDIGEFKVLKEKKEIKDSKELIRVLLDLRD